MSKVIDENLRLKIYDLLRRAKEMINIKNYSEAEALCDQAWELLPEPKADWDSSYVILNAAIKRLLEIGNNKKAILWIKDFTKYNSDYSEQYGPHFLLGAAYYADGQYDEAFDYLTQANNISKGRCFVEEQPKYKEFLKSRKG